MAILHAHATPHNVAFLAPHVPVPDTFPDEERKKKKRASFLIGKHPQRSNKGLRIIQLSAYLASVEYYNQQDKIQKH